MAASSPVRESYVLQGRGRIEPVWVGRCLRLFKTQNVNIRHLLLMQGDDPTCFATLDIRFVLSGQDNGFPHALQRLLNDLPEAHSVLTTL